VGDVGSASHMVGPKTIRSGHTKQECFGQPRALGPQKELSSTQSTDSSSSRLCASMQQKQTSERGREDERVRNGEAV
jgi:hypothetical protein